MKTFQLSPVADLRPVSADGNLVALDVGSDGCVYMVISLHPLDYIHHTVWGSFTKSIPDHPQRYRIVTLYEDQVILDFIVDQELFNIHYIQPLGNELLLACA